MFQRILVANRGEIARRVLRTCRRLGVETVAVCSTADREALHVRDADASVFIGESPVAASYLQQGAIVQAALDTGAQAIHPGYGLLSENAPFARAVQEAGLVFIGPRPETIALMGDKLRARALASEAGLPVLPASHAVCVDDPVALEEAGARVGFPILVKLSAGGGGIGMTRVDEPRKLVKAVAKAARRGASAFGDSTAYLERALDRPRHVEVQVLCDGQGTALHLFERDCSLQRRHQKVVEEAPAPGMPDALRAQLCEGAVALCRRVGYLGAGTVEFLVGADGAHHFLEMNTRIQVEHPVTEMITGLDLVEWQLRIAAGEALPFGQADVRREGHAIELRLYAEDPVRFLPRPGTIERWTPPTGEGIRVDHALESGAEVTPFYDPMLAKLVAWGPDRGTAIARARAALASMELTGLTHNGPLHAAILADPGFLAGEVHTGLLTSLSVEV
jgi:acetyl-CoA carboxylase, biotin carboxylase subunit